MRRILFFVVSLLFLSVWVKAATRNNLDGKWEGKVKISPQVALRLVINIAGSDTDNPSVTMDSPDQNSYGISMRVKYIDNDSISVGVDQLSLNYNGKLENDTIKGNFSQGMFSVPLDLTTVITKANRPQTPLPPFDYVTEEVSFPSCLDKAGLNGTLSAPDGFDYNTPVVVLMSGSGTQNRDEELFEHKPFAVIADYLARNGVATLRYDDRGFDPSTGLKPNSTTYDNAMDAKGAVEYLRERGFKNIGLLGHSEGGLMADILASKDGNIKFVIEVGGPSVSGDEILIAQNGFLLRDGKMPEEYVTMYEDAMRGIFNSQKDKDAVPFIESDYALFSAESAANPVLAPLAKNLKENFMNLPPWLHYFINYDPLPDIKKIKAPVFFIYGEKDMQVSPQLNVGPLKETLGTSAMIKVYPGLNHLMQHCSTGMISEYGQIEETFAPEVLEDILKFITEAVK